MGLIDYSRELRQCTECSQRLRLDLFRLRDRGMGAKYYTHECKACYRKRMRLAKQRSRLGMLGIDKPTARVLVHNPIAFLHGPRESAQVVAL